MQHESDVIPARIGGAFKVLYRQAVTDLGDLIDSQDLTDLENFQNAFAMVVGYGLNQAAFAQEHGYQPATISRWVNGQKAPSPARRPPIIKAAYAMLQDAIAANEPLALRIPPPQDDEDAFQRPTGKPQIRA